MTTPCAKRRAKAFAIVVLPEHEPPVMAMKKDMAARWRGKRRSQGLSHTALLEIEVARRRRFFHQAFLDRARRAEQVALAVRHVEIEHFEHEVFALDPLGDDVDAVAREHRRHIRRRDLAHDGERRAAACRASI